MLVSAPFWGFDFGGFTMSVISVPAVVRVIDGGRRKDRPAEKKDGGRIIRFSDLRGRDRRLLRKMGLI